MLLSHKDIDVNALVMGDVTALSRLAKHGYKSLSGLKLLIEHPAFTFVKVNLLIELCFITNLTCSN